MKTCECGGDFLRHGVTHYLHRYAGMVGIRYKCRNCEKTFTVRVPEKDLARHPVKIKFNATGRPHTADWRMAA